MKVIVFGASGMVGQGALRECLLAKDVEQVLVVVRKPTGLPTEPHDPKLRELVHEDFSDFAPVAAQLAGYDACFWCLGVTSQGLDEAAYTRVTYDFTMAAARVLAADNPKMTWCFVSGAGTDSTEQGKTMWARVKGKAENGVAALFEHTYLFRPGIIRPMHGASSRTRSYRLFYVLGWPIVQLLRIIPNSMSSTENMGLAMLACARGKVTTKILQTREINAAAALGRAAGG